MIYSGHSNNNNMNLNNNHNKISIHPIYIIKIIQIKLSVMTNHNLNIKDEIFMNLLKYKIYQIRSNKNNNKLNSNIINKHKYIILINLSNLSNIYKLQQIINNNLDVLLDQIKLINV
jgi:hypothetical protein